MKNIFRIISITVLLFTVAISSYSQKKEITLEDIFVKRKFFSFNYFIPVSLNDGEHYAVLESDNSVNAYRFSDGELAKNIMPPLGELKNAEGIKEIDEFILSADNSKILLLTNTKQIYRRSSESDVFLFDVSSGTLKKINHSEKIQKPVFSPDGKYISYVFKNNLYVEDVNTLEVTPVTEDGKINEIINGLPDWVYEEELSMDVAFAWNSESNKIAFLRFDESKVKEYTLIRYGNVYPEVFKYKYPKAGEDNSELRLFVYDLNTDEKKELSLGEDKNIYIPRLKWTTNPNILSVVRLNRHQNYMDVLHYNMNHTEPDIFYADEDKYYLDEIYDFTYLKDNSIIALSGRSGFKHIFHIKPNKSIFQITKGDFEVSEILSVDENSERIFYISSEPSPVDRALYSVKLDGTGKKLLSKENGYTSAEITKNGNYIIERHSDANTPAVVNIKDSDGNLVRNVFNNRTQSEAHIEYGFANKEFFTFETSEKIKLNGWMMKPKNFNAEKKYPVLFYVYSGPGSQTVLNVYSSLEYLWSQYLCGKGYIIVSVDTRGTGGRGEEFQKQTYLKLGEYELKDHIEAAKYIGSLNYVDKDRIGIWGWSYGGYMVCLAMTKGEGLFKTGLAVAPVIDWRYYDNIYTERFMRTPEENPGGYYDNSPLNFTDKMKGNLLIVHGSDDDNVHPQNTFEFAEKLVEVNKQFDMHLYTNKNHNISGGNTRYHLFTKLSDFLFKNL